ncbi:hypothetical protein F0562_001318 [Nyssa sinensis]|uniref:Uncharacterized protein n=1 Tax=Nyssa sinensis TaxID=561372 RepID=A0A5J5C4B3_9ASTE|nr:hypothetical protein F0562_001318 [Nyssa sinensis]
MEVCDGDLADTRQRRREKNRIEKKKNKESTKSFRYGSSEEEGDREAATACLQRSADCVLRWKYVTEIWQIHGSEEERRTGSRRRRTRRVPNRSAMVAAKKRETEKLLLLAYRDRLTVFCGRRDSVEGMEVFGFGEQRFGSGFKDFFFQ